MRTAFINADVMTLDSATPRAAGLLVEDGVVAGLLTDSPVGTGADVKIVDCRGAAVVPGFHDCHAHLTDTGRLAGEHDLGGCSSVAEIVDRVARLPEPLIFAGSYEEHRVEERRAPLMRELDSAVSDRPVLLSRIDGHSCVVNSAAWALLQPLANEGVARDDEGNPTGRLFGPANYAAQRDFTQRLPAAVNRAADLRAAGLALQAGITTLHNVVVGDAPFEELEELRRSNAALPLRVFMKSCTTDVGKVKRLGGRIFGGDIFLDGSIGSHTAAVTEGYRDAAGNGLLYLSRDHLAELFDEAAEAGLSPGVHAIGDRAIEEAIAAWESVIRKRGPLRGVRPSIDHFEIARDDQISRAASCGLLLSMQPAFDFLWGGEAGMYAQRFGAAPARRMNLMGSALRASCIVCGGSDSPVTKLSALLGIQSCVDHHVPEERLTVEQALRAYTIDAAKMAFEEGQRGALKVGMAADFAVLESAPDKVPAERIKDIGVLMTVIGGDVRHSIAA